MGDHKYMCLYLERIDSPGDLDGKESACNAGDLGSIPGSGRSPREGNGNPLQYTCLENPIDRGAWQSIVHGVRKESDTTEPLSTEHQEPNTGPGTFQEPTCKPELLPALATKCTCAIISKVNFANKKNKKHFVFIFKACF